jgi:predicted ATPase/DNA-binding winged helix-turn-helix (wHTH) protein
MDAVEDELRFGPFRLSRHRRTLTAAEGPVPLGGRAFDLLAVLAANPGRLFAKHELIDRVWPGLIVEENNLHVQMVALRRALGGQQGIVQTVPGRGYRLIGDAPVPVAQQEALQEAGETTPGTDTVSSAAPLPEFIRPPLIGREQELAELRHCVERHRLVTITGPSGIGKTHLGLNLAESLRGDFSGFIRVADFAPLTEDSRVEATLIAGLGLRLIEGAARPEALAQALGNRRALLILDNCEHRLGGIAPLAETLLKTCPTLSMIATSQEPLRVEAEAAYRLSPLALPPAKATGPAEIAGYGAVALFLQRAEAADRHFRLDGGNSAAVADICRSLDGIPLALEMAAARVPALGLEGLRSRLDKRLRLLTSGRATAASRHRTLRATIAWSDELLDPADRQVFHRLGVFSGTFSAQAASAILREGDEDEWTILDALGRLVDKSLVVAEPGTEPRYRLLETPRLFALEQLGATTGRHLPCLARHAGFYADLMLQAYSEWETTEETAWLARYAPELDNVRAALDWAFGPQGDAELGVALAGAAGPLWEKSSLLAEGRRYLETAEPFAAEVSSQNRARLYRQIGNLWFGSDRPRALAALEQAEALYQAQSEPEERGAALALIGVAHSFMGDRSKAKQQLNAAKELLAGARRPKTLFNIYNNLGVIAAMETEFGAARGFFDQALRLARRARARQSEVTALINLAEIEFNLGETELAIERVSAAIGFLRADRLDEDLGWALVNIATYLLIAGRPAEAQRAATEALSLVTLVGGFILRVCLQQCALLAANAGNLAGAARLLGFVDAGYEAAGERREPTEQRVYDDLTQKLQAGLTPAALQQLAEEGAACTESIAAKAAAELLQPNEIERLQGTQKNGAAP